MKPHEQTRPMPECAPAAALPPRADRLVATRGDSSGSPSASDAAEQEYQSWIRLLRDSVQPSIGTHCKALASAIAIGSMPVAAGALAHGDDKTAYIVMVEFAVEAAESEAVVTTVRGLLDTIVQKQDGFQFARIHREIDGGKVVNYMQWSSKEAFDAFRSAHRHEVSAAVGRFSPKFVFYQVPYSIEPRR